VNVTLFCKYCGHILFIHVCGGIIAYVLSVKMKT